MTKTETTWDRVQLAPAVFIKAKEPLLAERALSRLRAAARNVDPNIDRATIDGATYQAGQLMQMTSPSLFGGGTFVEIPALEDANTDLMTDLETYLTNPAPDSWVIIRRNKGSKGARILNLVKDNRMPIVDCPQIRTWTEKKNLINADARRAGRRVDTEATAALIDAMPDASELATALDQLFSDTKGTITVDIVNTYYAGRIEANGFQVADAAVAGNTGKALALARHAYETGVDPVVIVAALAYKLRQMALVAGAASHGGTRQLGMSPWQVKNTQKELRHWSEAGLAEAITATATADAQVKGESRDPQYAVERAIIAITTARKKRLAY